MCQVLNMSGFWIFQNCQYARFLNFHVTQGLPLLVNMIENWICIRMQLWKASEYFRILNMSDFSIYKCYTRFQICQNNASINCSKNGRVLIMLGQSSQKFEFVPSSKYATIQNMERLQICQGYTGCWICLNNAEYAWICLHIPE